MSISKTLLHSFTAAVLIALMAMPVSAAVKQENKNTGNNSDNVNRIRIRHRHSVSQTNTATVNTAAVVGANTGGNVQEKNTTGGDIDSGKITGEFTVKNEVNKGAADFCEDGCTSDAPALDVDQENSNTGNNSDNRNRVRVRSSSSFTQNNTATVNTTFVVGADTGNNTSSKNTSGGDIDSGDISLDFDVSNKVN